MALAIGLALSHQSPKANPPGIVILRTWRTNGEQLVTFRSDAPHTEIAFASLVSVLDDGRTQPRTIRGSGGQLVPIPNGKETNYSLHFVALPIRGAMINSKPLPYTPGTYTIAYSPTESANRLRVGVAFERVGIEDYVGRIRSCWEQRTLGPIDGKSHKDAFFVISEPITNVVSLINH